MALKSQHFKNPVTAKSGIMFYGDPHGVWWPLFDVVEHKKPDAIVILGDLVEPKRYPESVQVARDALNKLLDAGIDVRLISGNHDTDTVAAHDLVFEEFGAHLIDGKVVELGRKKLRVAALGGVFRGRIWYPRGVENGGETAKFHSASGLLAATPKSERFRNRIPLKQHSTIFPETVRDLAQQKADILVCHEASSSHDFGFPVIDQLAADLGAKLIVHGHHHQAYSAHLKNGIRVRGVGMAEAWDLSESEIRGRINTSISVRPPRKASKTARAYENFRHRKTHAQRPPATALHSQPSADCGVRLHERVAAG